MALRARAPAKGWRRCCAYALVAVALGVALHGLGQDSLWSDEIVTARLTRQPLSSLSVAVQADPNHFPLYYLLQWLFRFAGSSEWGLRLPSAFAATVSVAGVFWLGSELLDERAGLAAALALATHPAHVWAAQEARYYAVIGMAAALSAAGLLSLVRRPSGRPATAFVLGTLAALYTHAFCLPMAAAEAAYCAGAVALGRRHGRGDLAKWLLGCGAAIALLSLPLIKYVLRLFRAEAGGTTPMVTWTTILELWYEYGARSQCLKFAYLALAIAAIVVVARYRRVSVALCLLWFAPLPLLALPKASHFFLAKYLYYLLPMYVALVGVDLASCARAVGRLGLSRSASLLLLLAGVANVPSLKAYYAAEKFNWRDAAAYLSQAAGPEDAIIALPPTEPELAWYYSPLAQGAPVVGFGSGQQTITSLLDAADVAEELYWIVLLPLGSLPDATALAESFDIATFYGVAVLRSRVPALEAAAEVLPRFAAACGADGVLAGPAWDTAGAVLESLDRPEEARAAFSNALAFFSEERVQHRLRGEVARLSGDWPLAVSEYQAAVAAVPDLASVYLRLAEALEATGNGTGAVAAYLSYWRLTQVQPSGLCIVQDMLAALGDADIVTPDVPIDTPYCDGAEAATCYVAATRFSLPTTGEARQVLFQHPQSSVTYSLPQSQGTTYLVSSPLLDPQAWNWGGDGVTFRVVAWQGVQPLVLGERTVGAQSQAWEDWVLPLPTGTTSLVLQTEPGLAGDANGDWAGWGTPLLVGLCDGG